MWELVLDVKSSTVRLIREEHFPLFSLRLCPASNDFYCVNMPLFLLLFFFKLYKDVANVARKIQMAVWVCVYTTCASTQCNRPASLGLHACAEQQTFRKILERAEFTQD